MITMDQRLKELYEAGLISYEEVCRRISSPVFLSHIAKPGEDDE
jgi:Tfp pilus assembly ATPase PilU